MAKKAGDSNFDRSSQDGSISAESNKEIVQEFMQNTTAHGWGHAARAPNLSLRTLWVFLTILALIINMCHVTMLVLQYLDFPYEQVSRVQLDEIVFPSVTICNILPLSATAVNVSLTNSTSKFSQWENTTQYFFNHMANDTDDPMRFRLLYERLRGPRGFYENIGDEVMELGHQPHDFILGCSYSHQPCSWKNFTQVRSSSYFNCYTFNSKENMVTQMTGPQAGLSLVLYLESNNEDYVHDGPYYTFLNTGNAAGVRVTIHPPNTRPSPMDSGFDIPPGFSSSVGVEVQRHDRLGAPYSECKNLLNDPSRPYTYSTQECTQECQQAYIVSKCGCLSADLPLNSAEYPSTLPYCGYFNDSDPLDIFKRSECEATKTMQFLTKEELNTNCSCDPPCQEYEYRTDVSYSYWPIELSQETFYNIYVKHNTHRDALKVWHNFRNFTPSELISRGLIRKNFVRLNVYISTLVIQEYVQQGSYTFFNLFSDIGGTFGLWIGMSLLTWGEVLELFIFMCCSWCKRFSGKLKGENKRVGNSPTNDLTGHGTKTLA